MFKTSLKTSYLVLCKSGKKKIRNVYSAMMFIGFSIQFCPLGEFGQEKSLSQELQVVISYSLLVSWRREIVEPKELMLKL